MSRQQNETKKYFSTHAEKWHATAQNREADKLNTLQQRYRCVLDGAKSAGQVRKFLDLGCGSGEMSALMAENGATCIGIDLAPEMVDTARRHIEDRKLSGLCSFHVGSALEVAPEGGPFDMVAALGLIEYISNDEMMTLFHRVHGLMREGGVFAVESRNRLFNLVTFNDYTRLEIESGNLQALMAEALAIADTDTQDECLDALATLEIIPEPLGSYPVGGIPVTVRHQFTPAQLCGTFRECGFKPIALHPYHYHIARPKFLSVHEALHARMATEMQEYLASTPSLLIQASAYVIHARRLSEPA